MTTITINISAMFSELEPWDCSNSVANLGPCAAEITWENALRVARDVTEWIVGPPLIKGDELDTAIKDAVDYISQWARETGTWDKTEIEGWTETEALALLVQNVASDMRMLGSDDRTFEECAQYYADTDWDSESEYPIMSVYIDGDRVLGQVYS